MFSGFTGEKFSQKFFFLNLVFVAGQSIDFLLLLWIRAKHFSCGIYFLCFFSNNFFSFIFPRKKVKKKQKFVYEPEISFIFIAAYKINENKSSSFLLFPSFLYEISKNRILNHWLRESTILRKKKNSGRIIGAVYIWRHVVTEGVEKVYF